MQEKLAKYDMAPNPQENQKPEIKRTTPLSDHPLGALKQSVEESIGEGFTVLADLALRKFGHKGIDKKPDWLAKATGTTHLVKGTDDIFSGIEKKYRDQGKSVVDAKIKAMVGTAVFFSLAFVETLPFTSGAKAVKHSPQLMASIRSATKESEVKALLKDSGVIVKDKEQESIAIKKLTESGDFEEIRSTLDKINEGKKINPTRGERERMTNPIADRMERVIKEDSRLYEVSEPIARRIGNIVRGVKSNLVIRHSGLDDVAKHMSNKGEPIDPKALSKYFETEHGLTNTRVIQSQKYADNMKTAMRKIDKSRVLKGDDMEGLMQARATAPKAKRLRERKLEEGLKGVGLSPRSGGRRFDATKRKAAKVFMQESG